MGRRRYTEEQFRSAVADPTVTTIAELCRRLGIRAGGGNYDVLRDYARTLGIDDDLFAGRDDRRRRRAPDLDDPHEVARVVVASSTLAEAIRRLRGEVSAHAYRQLRAHIAEHRLDTSHMVGHGWSAGRTLPASRVPAAELFDRPRVNTTTLRQKLLEEGYRAHRCEHCGRDRWQGNPIPLELDHVDGDRTHNALANLRLLCPNCHALTPTYRGRNIGRRPGNGRAVADG